MRTMATNSLRTILLSAFLSTAALTQVAGSASAGQVSVSAEGTKLRVQIASTVSLNQVVNALCSQQQIQCTGIEALSSFVMPGISIIGTDEEIIATLLQGTGMNYSISRAESGSPSALTVLGRAPATAEYANGTVGVNDDGGQAAQQVQHLQVADALTEQAPESAEESERSERVMQAIFGGASSANGVNTGDSATGLVNGDTTQAANPKLPEYLPFPDQFGNPIRTSPAAPPTVLPFPDHNGNPIPVVPVLVQGPPIPLTRNQ